MKKITRAVKRRYGMAARPVAVRTHVAWYWRGLLMLLALGVGVGLAGWMFDVGSRFSGLERGSPDREVAHLAERVRVLEEENRRLQVAQVKTDRRSRIDDAAQQDMELAMKSLQEENARLEEDLAFFRGMSSGERAPGIHISRFKVERAEAGQYRYQLLLIQSRQQNKPFKGRLQLLVTVQDGDRKHVVTLPQPAEASDRFAIVLNTYQKLEGVFQLNPAAAVKSIEARIFGEDPSRPRLARIVNLS